MSQKTNTRREVMLLFLFFFLFGFLRQVLCVTAVAVLFSRQIRLVRDLPASASCMLRLKVCTTITMSLFQIGCLILLPPPPSGVTTGIHQQQPEIGEFQHTTFNNQEIKSTKRNSSINNYRFVIYTELYILVIFNQYLQWEL